MFCSNRFHILTPMYVGFTNAVNSLYNVKKIVYVRMLAVEPRAFRRCVGSGTRRGIAALHPLEIVHVIAIYVAELESGAGRCIARRIGASFVFQVVPCRLKLSLYTFVFD